MAFTAVEQERKRSKLRPVFFARRFFFLDLAKKTIDEGRGLAIKEKNDGRKRRNGDEAGEPTIIFDRELTLMENFLC